MSIDSNDDYNSQLKSGNSVKDFEKEFLYKLLTNPQEMDRKHVIVRHHNGDLCSNIQQCVRFDRNGLVIDKECKYREEKQELGITGHYIKWLKDNNTKDKLNTQVPAYISFPKGFVSKELEDLKESVPLNEMIFVQANELAQKEDNGKYYLSDL